MPATCPQCGADHRIGPGSKGRANVVHCTCRLAVGGVHTASGCQVCGWQQLDEPCADPGKRARAFTYEVPTRGE